MAIIVFIKGHVNRYKPDCFHLKNKQNLIIVFQNNKCSSDAQEEVSITCWMVATQCLLKLLLANKQTKMFKYQICISLKLELSDFHSTITWHHLNWLRNWSPGGATCISCKFEHQMGPLVTIWATKRSYLHRLQIGPPSGTTCIGSKFGHQVVPLALVPMLATRLVTCMAPHCLELPYCVWENLRSQGPGLMNFLPLQPLIAACREFLQDGSAFGCSRQSRHTFYRI